SSRQAIMHNISELQARGAFVIGIITDGDTEMAGIVNKAIFIPDAPPELSTILAATALQLLAYYLGVLKGYNVDQPRNLAKAVTVE
ncbi:MAG TPA: glutamine--fructose-6-phosphate aminotransferase, partial [Patescibacteria group bacterium]|nr:glutamine--fructose-6-phosphate aminotransferase [Patescibacteria group bacterium]